ncbi:C-type lectin domain family 10 member A-like [Ruditapes philippinarum]|uniref:C-type lectin domain family 10 member A-like n=1 Tax=Ruditapes philippinarum TaxID=129788 RepID=UPI00295B1AF3|nr:C-type lectin domain family 10 member A-like [Ruditapes philippinarum]
MFMFIILILFFQTVATACPNGWVGHNGSCFLFSHDREDWTGAYEMCRIMKAQLVEIHSSIENDFLHEQTKSSGKNHWISLSDVSEEGSWTWMTSLTTVGDYMNWYPNEPSTTNSLNEPENCAVLYTSGQWNDAVCSEQNYYICEIIKDEGQIIG